MPSGAIKHHDDSVTQMSCSYLVKKYLHAISVDMRQYQ